MQADSGYCFAYLASAYTAVVVGTTTAFPVSYLSVVCVCVHAGFTYDMTGSYTVGFLVLLFISLTGLSLIITIYIIQRRRKKSAQMYSVTLTVQSPTANSKC